MNLNEMTVMLMKGNGMKGLANRVREMNQTFFVFVSPVRLGWRMFCMNGFQSDHSELIRQLTDGDEDCLVNE